MKKLIQWIVKKAYKREIDTAIEIINNQRNQINNLKEQLNYIKTRNIFNTDLYSLNERKYK